MVAQKMMLFGAVWAMSVAQVAGHAAINPMLGVQGTASRNDVKRPSGNDPCGGNASLDGANAVTADASGAFTVSIENFNG